MDGVVVAGVTPDRIESIRSPQAEPTVPHVAEVGPNWASVPAKPMLKVEEYVMSAVPTVRAAAAAEASLAAILDLSKLGTAIAAMIRMIATTISSSISDKPFCFFILFYERASRFS